MQSHANMLDRDARKPLSSPLPPQTPPVRPPGVLVFFFVICAFVTVWGLALSALSSREGEAERHADPGRTNYGLSSALYIPASTAEDTQLQRNKKRTEEDARIDGIDSNVDIVDDGGEERAPTRPNMPVTGAAAIATAKREPVQASSPVAVDVPGEEDRIQQNDVRRSQQEGPEQSRPTTQPPPLTEAPSKPLASSSVDDEVEDEISAAKEKPQTTQPRARRRYLYVVDYWERLNNIHRAMRNLVRVAQVAPYTLVEPFMYESMATGRLCTPGQFDTAGLAVQTASKYMNFSRAFDAGVYTTYADFASKVARRTEDGVDDGGGVLVDAAAYIFDKDAPFEMSSAAEDPFFDCERVFRALNYTFDDGIGWRIAPGLHAARAICIDGIRERTEAPVDSFMRAIYEKLESDGDGGNVSRGVACGDCTSLLVLNYRKHFIGRFGLPVVLEKGSKPFPPSAFGMSVAAKWQADAFEKQPYVAMQYRTGKTLTAFRDLAQWKHEKPYVRDVVSADYRTWVFGCADKLIDGALAERDALRKFTGTKGKIPVFLASDMYNEGWKHGEYSGAYIKPVMTDLKQHVDRRLDGVVTFDPDRAGIEQDVMGLSAVADAAIAYAANRFVTHDSSSMGQYVKENRAVWRHVRSRVVACEDPSKNETIVGRVKEALDKLASS